MGAVGGAAAAVAASVARVAPVEAANGDPVQVGHAHIGSSTTAIATTGAGKAGIVGQNTANNSDSTGVKGISVGGNAVFGQAFGGGIGLRGTAIGGYAIRAERGRIMVQEVSGTAVIKKGRRSVTIKPGVDINAKTFVLLTPKANIGARAVWYGIKPTRNEIVIKMSATRGAPTKIAWLALEKG